MLFVEDEEGCLLLRRPRSQTQAIWVGKFQDQGQMLGKIIIFKDTKPGGAELDRAWMERRTRLWVGLKEKELGSWDRVVCVLFWIAVPLPFVGHLQRAAFLNCIWQVSSFGVLKGSGNSWEAPAARDVLDNGGKALRGAITFGPGLLIYICKTTWRRFWWKAIVSSSTPLHPQSYFPEASSFNCFCFWFFGYIETSK